MGLRANPSALLHCRYQRQLFPETRLVDVSGQRGCASGDRDAAAALTL